MSTRNQFLVGLVLCEQKPGAMTYLKACNPPDFNFTNELEIIINNAFPPTQPQSNIIYSFTTRRHYCFNLIIVLPDILYSYIILTKLKIPTVYIKFLAELNRSFSLVEDKKFDPLPLFDYTYSLISTWKWVSQMRFLAQFPNGAFYIEVDNDTFCCASFDPQSFFPTDTIKEIWRTLITGAGLHIICDDPEVLTDASFAAQSITSPLQYRDNIMITYNFEDERFKDADAYSIIATPSGVDSSIFKNFRYAVEARRTGVNLTSSSANKLREEVKAQTKRVVEINVFMMDRMLRKNPFNDLLEGPYMTDDADPLFEPKKKKKLPVLLPDEYRMVEKTETFRNYRRKVLYRNTFRQNFLSVKPEEILTQQSLQHLKVLDTKLKELEAAFNKDIHFASVVRVHLSIIKKLLGKNSSSNKKATFSPGSLPPSRPLGKANIANNPNHRGQNNNDNNNTNNQNNESQDISENTTGSRNNKTIKDNPNNNSFSNLPKIVNFNGTFPSGNFDPKNGSNDSQENNNTSESSSNLSPRSTENGLNRLKVNDESVSLSCDFIEKGVKDSSFDDVRERTASDPNIQPDVSSS